MAAPHVRPRCIRGTAIATAPSTLAIRPRASRKHDLADKHGVNLEGALTWAFEFEDHPYFAGFRSLATRGVDKPVLNVFRMFAKMSGQRLPADSNASVPLETMLKSGVRERPDVAALASLDKNKLCVMVWHYHDDQVPGPSADVDLALSGLPIPAGRARLQHFRIDDEHSNAYTVWQKMGSPQKPSPEQYRSLEQAGQLAALPEPHAVDVENRRASLRFSLPRQAVSLVVIEW